MYVVVDGSRRERSFSLSPSNHSQQLRHHVTSSPEMTLQPEPKLNSRPSSARESTSGSKSDFLAFHTAKVAPLDLSGATTDNNTLTPAADSGTKPQFTLNRPPGKFKKLRGQLKGLASLREEEGEEDEDGDRTSCKAKVFILLVSLCSLTLGVALVVIGAQRQLRDCIAMGCICLVIAFFMTLVFIILLCRDGIRLPKLKKRRDEVTLVTPGGDGVNTARTADIDWTMDEPDQYFAALGDTTAAGIQRQRRPSNAELYGKDEAERRVAKLSRQRRMASAARSTPLTISAIDVDNRESTMDFDSDGAPTPPPMVTIPKRGALDPDEGLKRDSADEFKSQTEIGVSTTKVALSNAPLPHGIKPIPGMELETHAIKREITGMYEEPTEREKTMASVEKSLQELE